MGSQRFDLTVRGRHHAVTASDVGLRREVVWLVDGAEVARRTTIDDRFHLDAEGHGRVELRAGLRGLRRVTLHVDGSVIDLVPEPGSPAARREERIRRRPRLYAVLQTLAAVAKVLVPLLGVGIVFRWLPDWDLPRIPWLDLDLPRIHWPDVPVIPWPQIPWPDWNLPDWVRDVLRLLKYVWPVLLALGLAVAEVRRRRVHDRRRQDLAEESLALVRARLAADLRAHLDQRRRKESP